MPYASNVVTREPGTYRSVQVQTNPYNNERTQITSDFSSTAKQVTWSRSGTKTPGFNNPNRSPLLPVNPYSFRIEIENRMKGSYREVTPPVRSSGIFGQDKTVTGTSGGQPGYGKTQLSSTEVNRARARLEQKLILKVKDGKANLALAYAERKKTRDLIAESLVKLTMAYSRARKGDLAGAAKAMGVSPRERTRAFSRKSVATSWLELQYGWKPLLSDIYGAADAYHKHMSPLDRIQRVRAVEALSALTPEFNTSASDSNLMNLTKEVLEVRGGLTFKIGGPLGQAPKALAELGITNPLMLAWELLPWSFVVDWFLPIGDFLDSLDATTGTEFVQGYVTTFKKTTVTTVRTYKSSGTTQRVGEERGSREIVEVNRDVLTKYPRPHFPDFKDPFSHVHFFNAVALFITNSRK